MKTTITAKLKRHTTPGICRIACNTDCLSWRAEFGESLRFFTCGKLHNVLTLDMWLGKVHNTWLKAIKNSWVELKTSSQVLW